MQFAVTESSRATRSLFLLIALGSAAGVIDSGIALQRHFAKSATTYCDFGQKLNCDIVNRSEYSTMLGIPVALIGVAGYAALSCSRPYGGFALRLPRTCWQRLLRVSPMRSISRTSKPTY